MAYSWKGKAISPLPWRQLPLPRQPCVPPSPPVGSSRSARARAGDVCECTGQGARSSRLLGEAPSPENATLEPLQHSSKLKKSYGFTFHASHRSLHGLLAYIVHPSLSTFIFIAQVGIFTGNTQNDPQLLRTIALFPFLLLLSRHPTAYVCVPPLGRRPTFASSTRGRRRCCRLVS